MKTRFENFNLFIFCEQKSSIRNVKVPKWLTASVVFVFSFFSDLFQLDSTSEADKNGKE